MEKNKPIKEDIPAKGEQVILENGEIVIGDGIHSINELPRPKILHD